MPNDPMYQAVPRGGYRLDEADYRCMEIETVVCKACGCVIPKDDAERDEYDTVFLCAECAKEERRLNAGWIS
jgi:hypothetical protein